MEANTPASIPNTPAALTVGIPHWPKVVRKKRWAPNNENNVVSKTKSELYTTDHFKRMRNSYHQGKASSDVQHADRLNARWDVILFNREGSRHYGLRHDNLVLSKELIKVELPPWKIWKFEVSSVSPSSSFWRRLCKSFTVIIRPLSTRLMKTNFHSPTGAEPQFL